MKNVKIGLFILMLLIAFNFSCTKDELVVPDESTEALVEELNDEPAHSLKFQQKVTEYNAGSTIAMTTHLGVLCAIINNGLYEINFYNKTKQRIGTANWPSTIDMTSDNGYYLYALHYNGLYRINATNGSYTRLGSAGAWPSSITSFITYLNGWLYIQHNNGIYKVNPSNGSYSKLGTASWPNNSTKGLTAFNGYLYILNYNSLYKVNPSTGSYSYIGSQGQFPSYYTGGLTATRYRLIFSQYNYIVGKWYFMSVNSSGNLSTLPLYTPFNKNGGVLNSPITKACGYQIFEHEDGWLREIVDDLTL